MRSLWCILLAALAACSSTGKVALTEADRDAVRAIAERLCEHGSEELLETLGDGGIPEFVPEALGVLEALTRGLERPEGPSARSGHPVPDPRASLEAWSDGSTTRCGTGLGPVGEPGSSSWTTSSTSPWSRRKPERPAASTCRSPGPECTPTRAQRAPARSRAWSAS